jgi:tetratricopeptide (TPR) repeat protein
MPDTPNLPVDYSFSFQIPGPGGQKITAEEAEHILLERVKKQEEALGSALLDLARFYQQNGHYQIAKTIIDRVEELARGPEEKAHCHLRLGQLAEKMDDFEAAVSYYSQAYRLEPAITDVWYFINNNLGYSLNQLGRYEEAEGYCRAAIKIDPKRHNAYKNLGISLQGQGALAEAAANYIQAVRNEASDPRAFLLLRELLSEKPQLLRENPALVTDLENCGKAVAFAKEFIDNLLEDYNK